MAEIKLCGLGHSYGSNPNTQVDYALKPVNLTWEDGKTYALLGPSGCGKSTMLNIISGLLKPSAGQLMFDGKDVTNLSTTERNIAQVFQFPVIYTTKSVRQNIAFPLECKRIQPEQIKKRVEHIAELLELTHLLDKPARKLSADQKQLISLGRGLVREDVGAVLLDEPLTVIDPQLKFSLRRKLREINRVTGTTMILVTHDQSEAMSFADEIVLMKDGMVQQAGAPEVLFSRPRNEFVGYFIGSPPLNMIDAQAVQKNRITKLSDVMSNQNQAGRRVQLGFRPEHIILEHCDNALLGVGTISKVEHVGVDSIITLEIHHGTKVKAKIRGLDGLSGMEVGVKIGVNVNEEDCLVYVNGHLQS